MEREHKRIEMGIVIAGMEVVKLVGKGGKFNQKPNFLELFEEGNEIIEEIATARKHNLFIPLNQRFGSDL